jgi:hypothetical protein
VTIVCSNCLVAYCIHTNYIPVCGVKPCKNRHLLEWRAVSLSTIQELTAPRCHACCPWIGGLLGPNKKVDQHLFRGRCILQGGAPSYKKWCLLVYKHHEYYSYIYYKPWLSHLISLNYISINISLSCLSHDPPIPTCWWRNCRTRHLLAGGPQGRVFRVFFAHSPPENLLKIEGYRKIWRVNEVFMFRFFEFGSLNINDLDIQ